MKIPASTALAVVAVFLPIVTCAAEEEDDRSCEKRDKEANEVGGNVVTSCNYWCRPNKDSPNYYVNKYYPDGTKCQYTESLQSLCIQNECHHPESEIYQN
uniref:Putative basic tail protein n=1 Tax=Ixodes ricinus TaxID=34613 RepID=A0A0K8RF87_IXORI